MDDDQDDTMESKASNCPEPSGDPGRDDKANGRWYLDESRRAEQLNYAPGMDKYSQPLNSNAYALTNPPPLFITTHTPQHPRTSRLFYLKQDHTMGNLITNYCLKIPGCTFAAYRVAHPDDLYMEIRLDIDPTELSLLGYQNPAKEVLKRAVRQVYNDVGILRRNLTVERVRWGFINGERNAALDAAILSAGVGAGAGGGQQNDTDSDVSIGADSLSSSPMPFQQASSPVYSPQYISNSDAPTPTATGAGAGYVDGDAGGGHGGGSAPIGTESPPYHPCSRSASPSQSAGNTGTLAQELDGGGEDSMGLSAAGRDFLMHDSQ